MPIQPAKINTILSPLIINKNCRYWSCLLFQIQPKYMLLALNYSILTDLICLYIWIASPLNKKWNDSLLTFTDIYVVSVCKFRRIKIESYCGPYVCFYILLQVHCGAIQGGILVKRKVCIIIKLFRAFR